MEICSSEHPEIVYNEGGEDSELNKCPLCEAIEEICEVINEKEELEKRVEDLEEKQKGLIK